MIVVHRDMQTNVCKKLHVFEVHTCFDWSLLGGSAFEGVGDADSSSRLTASLPCVTTFSIAAGTCMTTLPELV